MKYQLYSSPPSVFLDVYVDESSSYHSILLFSLDSFQNKVIERFIGPPERFLFEGNKLSFGEDLEDRGEDQ